MANQKSKFSTSTLIEAGNLYRWLTQAEFDKLMLNFSLDEEIPPGYGISVENKTNRLVKFAKENPFHQTTEGKNLEEEMVEQTKVVSEQHDRAALERALARDCFVHTKDGDLVKTLPPIADLPEANDELHSLLVELNLKVAKGHLDQAINNHADGQWAAANSQIRSFLEELFNETSRYLDSEKGSNPMNSAGRRARLAKIDPPFLLEPLNEWSNDGKNFVEGVFKRLHPEGPHPGLSDDEDCTFRLHMALIIGRHYLRRYKNRLS